MGFRSEKGIAGRRWIIFAALAFVFLLGMLSPAFASVGRFTVVKGKIDILKPGQTRAVTAKVDDTVSPGDVIRAKSNSFAEVVFTDNSALKVAENTRVQIKDFVVNANGKRESGTLRLLRGKIRTTVPKTFGSLVPVSSSKSTFEVETPTAVAGVRGTDFIVAFLFGATRVYVVDGTVDAWNILFPEDPVRLGAGRFIVIRHDQRPSDEQWIPRFELARFEDDFSRAGMTDYHTAGRDGSDFEAPREISSRLLDLPVTETNTVLLSGSTFSGTLSGADSTSYYLSLSGTMKGTYTGNTWTATISGTFNDLLMGTQYWSGTFSGTDTNGNPVTANIGVPPPLCDCNLLGTWTNGSVSPGTWSAPIKGSHQNGTFTGTISGTTSGGSSGTFTGTGSGTW